MSFARLPDMMVTSENPLSVFALKQASNAARYQSGRLADMVHVTRRVVSSQPRLQNLRVTIPRPGRVDVLG
jgi:hypothetical protein